MPQKEQSSIQEKLSLKKLSEIKSSIEAIERQLDDIRKQSSDFVIIKLEDWCDEFNNAVQLYRPLNAPIEQLERYINKLSDTKNIQYTISLLHHSWGLLHP